ncbi:Uncharacterized protein Rs2_02829 [Raphanus sativus]|nr:Uncharacterized protein Rs2_02829 [Raphanus sativus]
MKEEIETNYVHHARSLCQYFRSFLCFLHKRERDRMIRKTGKEVVKVGNLRVTRTAPIVSRKVMILDLAVFIFPRQFGRSLDRNTLREMLNGRKINLTLRLEVRVNQWDRPPNPLTGKTGPPMITAPHRVPHLHNVPRPRMDHTDVWKGIWNRPKHRNKLLRDRRGVKSDVEEELSPIVKIGNSSPYYQHYGTRSQSPGGRLLVVLQPQKNLKMVCSEG